MRGSSSTSSAAIQGGRGDESTTEASVRAAAAIADRALQENRAVGMTVNVGRTAFLPPDRGGRQHLKIMQLLAAVEADGNQPLVETLIGTVGRLRRGMTAVVITPSPRSVLGPAARLAARPGRRVRGRHARCAPRIDRQAAEARAHQTGEVAAPDPKRPSSSRNGRGHCATLSPNTSCRRSISRRAVRSARSWPDEPPDAARAGRGLVHPRAGHPHLPDDGLGDGRRRLGPRSRQIPRLPAARRDRWRPRRVHRPEGRLGALADASSSGRSSRRCSCRSSSRSSCIPPVPRSTTCSRRPPTPWSRHGPISRSRARARRSSTSTTS